MFPRPVAFGIVVLACMAAAATGGYLATRHNAVPDATAVSAAPAAPEAAAEAQARQTDAAPGIVVPDERPTFDRILAPPAPTAVPRANTPDTPSRTASPAHKTARVPAARPVPAAKPDPAAPPEQPAPAPSAPLPAEPVSGNAPALAAPSVPAWPVPPPEPEYEELTLPADSVIGLQLDTTVSSETAAIEDRVDARVTRDVTAGDAVAIPAGARMLGTVTLVEHGGKIKERGRLGVRFHTVILPDGTRTSLNTDTVYRESESPAKKSAAKIGGAAAGGAILGAILGGKKGAAIGGSIGAAGGTAAVMAGNEQNVTLPVGTLLNIRLLTPTIILVPR